MAGNDRGDVVDLDDRRHKPVDRIEKHVADKSNKIPNGEGRKERQHEIGAWFDAIESKRLPKILFRRNQIDFSGEVEEPGQSCRAIDQEPPYFDAGTFDLALKHIVQKAGSEPEIGKDVADADLDQVGQDEIISLCHGLEHKSIELQVEFEDVGVHRFPGIILLTGSLIGPGKGINRFVRWSLWRRWGSRCRNLLRDWLRVAQPL